LSKIFFLSGVIFLGKKLAIDGCLRLSVLVEADVAKVEIGGIVVKGDEVVFEDIETRAVKPDEVVFEDVGTRAVKPDELTTLSTSGVLSLSLSTYSIK